MVCLRYTKKNRNNNNNKTGNLITFKKFTTIEH